MGQAVQFKVDRREFDRTLKIYREYSKKDLATIVNTKALFVARRAIAETPKASRSKIEDYLGRFVRSTRVTKKGKERGVRTLVLATAARVAAPLAALLVQIRRRAKGERGLYGQAMEKAVKKLVGAIFRSIGFLKSGWIPAVRILAPLADRGGPRQEAGVKQVGREKGTAEPAREGSWSVKATITNWAESLKDYKQALLIYGGPALQRAFDAEEASMREYIERKQKESAARAGIRQK